MKEQGKDTTVSEEEMQANENDVNSEESVSEDTDSHEPVEPTNLEQEDSATEELEGEIKKLTEEVE